MEDKHAHECNKERKYLVSQRPIDTEEVDIRNTSCPHRIVSINDKCSLEEGGEWTLVAVELLVGSEKATQHSYGAVWRHRRGFTPFVFYAPMG